MTQQQTKRKAGPGRQPQTGNTKRRGERLQTTLQFTTDRSACQDTPADDVEQATQRVRAAAQAARDDFWRLAETGFFEQSELAAAVYRDLVGLLGKRGVIDEN
jgi:hypothetical protein